MPLPPAPVAPLPEEEPAAEAAPPAPQAPVEEATELKGVVAHVNPLAGSYALAIEGGELVPIHARALPGAGTRLTVLGERLANGTFAEAEAPELRKQAAQVAFRGAVSFVGPDPADPAYIVSGRGVSLLVHVNPDPSGAVPPLPALGVYVAVTAAIGEPADGTEPAPPVVLLQREVEVEVGEPATYLDLAGVLTAVVPESAQISLSADDAREGGADLVLSPAPDRPDEARARRLLHGDGERRG